MLKRDHEQNFAKTALELMSACAVVPTPENFELFYAHAAGENAAISHALTQMMAQKKVITSEMLQDLRMRGQSSARAARAMDSSARA